LQLLRFGCSSKRKMETENMSAAIIRVATLFLNEHYKEKKEMQLDNREQQNESSILRQHSRRDGLHLL
jgi:hypothetical protein